MKHLLPLVLLLLPVLARADALQAAGLAGAFNIFCVASLVFVIWLVVLAIVSLRRPHAPGLLKHYVLLLAALAVASVIAALLQFFLKPLLALVAVALLLLTVALVRRTGAAK